MFSSLNDYEEMNTINYVHFQRLLFCLFRVDFKLKDVMYKSQLNYLASWNFSIIILEVVFQVN